MKSLFSALCKYKRKFSSRKTHCCKTRPCSWRSFTWMVFCCIQKWYTVLESIVQNMQSRIHCHSSCRFPCFLAQAMGSGTLGHDLFWCRSFAYSFPIHNEMVHVLKFSVGYYARIQEFPFELFVCGAAIPMRANWPASEWLSDLFCYQLPFWYCGRLLDLTKKLLDLVKHLRLHTNDIWDRFNCRLIMWGAHD